MEIILAIVVASAVIFFGALISMGNERQRKAIDNLSEQITLWAIQDLQIKREKLSYELKIQSPIEWFKKLAVKVIGANHDIQYIEFFDQSKSIVFADSVSKLRLVFCPFSPSEINKTFSEKKSRLSHFSNPHPLSFMKKNLKTYTFSALNSGIMFDIELSSAWKGLTGDELIQTNILWVYILQ